MSTGFKYSFTCNERMLKGMLASTESYWTKSVSHVEITKEEHDAFHQVAWEKEPRNPTKKEDSILRKAAIRSAKVVDKGALMPQFSSIENFFGEVEEKPKRKAPAKKVAKKAAKK